MTIIALPTMGGGGINSNVSPRFGRCQSFTFVTVEDGEIQKVKTVPNSAANAMGGAGIQAAQIVGNNGATEVICGFLGPNASQGLSSLNLKIYQIPNQQLTVKQAIDMYLKGELQEISQANVGAHYGMGGGGRGMGGGMGRRRF